MWLIGDQTHQSQQQHYVKKELQYNLLQLFTSVSFHDVPDLSSRGQCKVFLLIISSDKSQNPASEACTSFINVLLQPYSSLFIQFRYSANPSSCFCLSLSLSLSHALPQAHTHAHNTNTHTQTQILLHTILSVPRSHLNPPLCWLQWRSRHQSLPWQRWHHINTTATSTSLYIH